MKASAIICELNPLHNGHKYIMDKAREDSNPLVMVMSGNFVQRGCPACVDKWTRAKAALSEGADLVIELPDIYSCSSAEYFAKGAISILKATKLEYNLLFGIEGDNRGALSKAVMQRLGKSYLDDAKERMSLGDSYASSSLDEVLKSNNILALEYTVAVNELGAENVTPVPVERTGKKSHIETASEIRNKLSNTNELSCFLPKASFKILSESFEAGLGPINPAPIENYIIAMLRKISAENLSKQAFVSEGLEHKLINEAYRCTTFADLVSACTSKRYTSSRIRRALYSLVTGTTSDLLNEFKYKAPYIRILGFSKIGAEAVSEICKKTDIPVLINASDREKLTGNARKVFENQVSATALYEMCLPKQGTRNADTELTHPPVKV